VRKIAVECAQTQQTRQRRQIHRRYVRSVCRWRVAQRKSL
jgi:hypothetical protein